LKTVRAKVTKSHMTLVTVCKYVYNIGACNLNRDASLQSQVVKNINQQNLEHEPHCIKQVLNAKRLQQLVLGHQRRAYS
jgi:GH24 family phage-related lysozyme (muramidase)